MKEVIRIIIKGSSGYGPIDEAYEDKVTIGFDSIRYEFIPKVHGSSNRASKWSYKTTSLTFSKLFNEVVSAIEEILSRNDDDFVCDIGVTTFIVHYSDKAKISRDFFLPSDDFRECFAIIKQMVPSCEAIPAVLRTSEDR